MTYEKALNQLFESDDFKKIATLQKEGSNLRVYIKRYREKKLKETSGKRLLLQFGYVENWEKKKGKK